MSIGENIRKRRIELKLSQQELADALGFKTRSSIAKIENSKNNLPQNKLLALANILNTTVDCLFSGNFMTKDHSYTGQIISNNTKQYSSTHRKCAAVILAGGKLHVNKYKIPYQFVTVKEKPIIIYTMEAYQRHPLIDEIYVVCVEGWEDFLPAYTDKYSITKFCGIIPAGEKGIVSVKNAVEWLTSTHKTSDIIILQESTRPLVDTETISNAIRCCKKYGTAVTYTYLEETTPFLIDKNQKSIKHIDAYSLITLQSPEVFTLGALRLAFIDALKINHPLTETSCSVFLHHIGRELSFCEGNHNNLRVIYEEDLKLFEALIS